MMTTEVLSDILESVRQALSELMRGVIRIITSDEKSLTQCLCEMKQTWSAALCSGHMRVIWGYRGSSGLV